MAVRRGKGRATLSQGLDREIYQIVRKLVDEQSQYDRPDFRLTVSVVYDRIKRSNSSLNRKSKHLLEDSIERVISVIKEDEVEEDNELDTVEGDFEGMQGSDPEPAEANAMNRSIVSLWAEPKPTSSTASPQPGTPILEGAKAGTSTGSGDGPHIQSISQRKRERLEPASKRRRQDRETREVERPPLPNVSLADLGGVESVIRELTTLVARPLLYPDIYTASKIQPPRGVLLHGPPGCGKTMISNAFAAHIGVSFLPISAPSIVSGMSGESEKKLRDYFEEARRMAPCLIFIDEIDAILPKRESAQREMEKRIVAQMLTCMDDLALERTEGKPVIVLAATNRPDSLDPALRRGGRFDKEINLTVPSEPVREQILYALTRHVKLASPGPDFKVLAKMTPGFVGADLKDLVSRAGSAAIERCFATISAQMTRTDAMDIENGPDKTSLSPELRVLDELIHHAKEPLTAEQLELIYVTNDDFLTALPEVQPSSKREGFATIPDTTWSDIGALQDVREELQMTIVEPIKTPERYERVGITTPTGVLLWGPPGCGKTLLAKAVANESRANFISVKGPELLNKYVGESERAVRQVFTRARSSVPCVIFFDELDALVPRRDDSLSESSARVVNTLLTELDGLSSRAGIYVIAATNRPDIIDPAMLRGGRLETLLFVDLPGSSERSEILSTLVRTKGIHVGGANVAEVAARCDGFSGADLESLLRAAGVNAIRRSMRLGPQEEIMEEEKGISNVDFEAALEKVRPSVLDIEKYRKLRRKWGESL